MGHTKKQPLSKRQAFLILTVLFSLLFIVLLLVGSYLISLGTLPHKQFGIAAFLFAFASVMAKFGCLAMYIRHTAKEKALQQQQNKQP